MIMFFLPWWTYVLIGTVAFTCAYAGIWLANIAEPGIKQDDEDGPFPCLAWFGTDNDGSELWCLLQHGHGGAHRDLFEMSDTAFTREPDEVPCQCHDEEGFSVLRQTNAAGEVCIDESPDYIPGSAPLPPLPQRLSKVPAQTEHNDPWPMCDRRSVDGVCDMSKGHPGPHEYI